MQPVLSEPRICRSCEKPIKGRSDKKYCDDQCRNQYNNRQKSADHGILRMVNTTLARNRRILQSLLPDQKDRARYGRDQLLFRGFSFRYFTHSHTSKMGITYYYCYDYGYRELGNGGYLIVRKKRD